MTAFYLCASTGFADELEDVARILRVRGHVVTSRWHAGTFGWWSGDHVHGELVARSDLDDLRAADVLVARTGEPSGRRSRGGRHAELGAAIVMRKKIVLVGDPEHVFHHWRGTERFQTWHAFLWHTVSPEAAADLLGSTPGT